MNPKTITFCALTLFGFALESSFAYSAPLEVSAKQTVVGVVVANKTTRSLSDDKIAALLHEDTQNKAEQICQALLGKKAEIKRLRSGNIASTNRKWTINTQFECFKSFQNLKFAVSQIATFIEQNQYPHLNQKAEDLLASFTGVEGQLSELLRRKKILPSIERISTVLGREDIAAQARAASGIFLDETVTVLQPE